MADMLDALTSAGTFSTMITLLRTAGMLAQLKDPGPITVFAPRDSAFTRLPAGALEDLLENPPHLRQVLSYHVIPGNFTVDKIKGKHRHSLATPEGAHIFIDTALSGHLRVNGSTITRADILVDNGVLHIIDCVILPETLGKTRVS